MTANHITKAIAIVGLSPLARALGVTYQAVRKWERANCLPRTEWTGETCYAQTIERLTEGQIKAKQMLRRPTRIAA
jgi:DNA-binding transcriptional regulator YdaS (Cro superfamily)